MILLLVLLILIVVAFVLAPAPLASAADDAPGQAVRRESRCTGLIVAGSCNNATTQTMPAREERDPFATVGRVCVGGVIVAAFGAAVHGGLGLYRELTG